LNFLAAELFTDSVLFCFVCRMMILGRKFVRVPQPTAGKPKEKPTHMYLIDPDKVSFALRAPTIKAFLYIGTEDELSDFKHEAIDKLATNAPFEQVKVTVEFYGVERAVKLHEDAFGDFEIKASDIAGMFWRRLFYMILCEDILEIVPIMAPKKVAPKDWEMDVPADQVGDVMKMFQNMAAGGMPVHFDKDFKP
jgi:hypothetical protein